MTAPMTTNPKHKLAELKAKAEAATPGPWQVAPSEGKVSRELFVATAESPLDGGNVICTAPLTPASLKRWRAGNAAHIAACDPQTILDLISRVEASPAIPSGEQIELETTATEIERWTRKTDDTTIPSVDYILDEGDLGRLLRDFAKLQARAIPSLETPEERQAKIVALVRSFRFDNDSDYTYGQQIARAIESGDYLRSGGGE